MRRTVQAAFLCACLLCLLPSAFAATPEPQPVKVLVVLDVSGSMAAPAGHGLDRLQAARDALAALVHTLPRNSSVGLRVYGASYGGRNRSISCRDTQLVSPINGLQPEKLIAAARKLKPTGDTPIGLALKYSASDLQETKASGKPVIVLISDGRDNCSPPGTPPCQVVQGLKNQGVKVRIETVGVALQNDPAAASALQCISGRTGGNYYDAGDADAISAALERISRETIEQLGAGKRVARVGRKSQAPLIRPGTYRFSLRPGQVAWFRFKSTEGQRPRVLATVDGLPSLRVPAANRNCPAWRAELYNPYGEGGSFPPYGNSGEFDGVGIGSTGASSTGKLDPYSQGIDFTGTWSMQLSLARDTVDQCSKSLPGRPYEARFSLQLGAGSGPSPRASASPSSTTSPTPSASPSGSAAGDDSVRRKYDNPVDPSSSPGWLPAAVAVTITLLVGGAIIGFMRLRRRRQRGW